MSAHDQKQPPRIGCAGWALRSEHKPLFAGAGSHLERYASRFNAVEVNSCFYRNHKPSTWAKWAASTPDSFRFSFKLAKAITHEARLKCDRATFVAVIEQVRELGDRLGPMLVQLPPSLKYEAATVGSFFQMLRQAYDGPVACEPRHASWFTPEVDQHLRELRISGVAADPVRDDQPFAPFGDRGLVYYRLHGSPRIYYSKYSSAFLREFDKSIQEHVAQSRAVWCIFDNTAEGHAIDNALELQALLGSPRNSARPQTSSQPSPSLHDPSVDSQNPQER